ncbi:hypothetical protein K0M31_000673 [Melipona bicolor]|uniref:peptidylprolyl isomerase n=1 Tax=Melipona bicolor TaxID=60889 RepID=A0AA40GES5_9HYME|nr:hypothetical protein K0M31_000673 [Melipona bicolor]
MFWGLILEPHRRYTQTVEKSFHVSMASLNLQKADDNVVQVMLYYEDSCYLLCNLKKSTTWQVPLDLNFHEGTTIAFICHGHGQVHLTGYLIPDDDLDELEEEEDEQVPQLVEKQSKRKATDSLKSEKNIKRSKQEIEAESSDEDIDLDGMIEEHNSDESEEEDEESLTKYLSSLYNEEGTEKDEEGEEEEEEDEEEKIKLQQKDKKNKQQEKKKVVNGKEAKQKRDKGKQQQNEMNIQSDQKIRLVEGGVQIKELKIGNGSVAKKGKYISVYYVGRLKNGKIFDSSTHGDGFKFRLGKGEVIKGWDVGIVGMKVGGKRHITIPPAMAYGAKGSPPIIPGNSTLTFEIELRNVH